MGITYRLRQLRANLVAGPLHDAARREIASILGPDELDLFYRFTFADQWHSYRVLSTLQDAGYNDPDLWAAALMHDIGKVRCPLNPWDRTLIVVGGALFPNRSESWGRGDMEGWRRPFVARALHPSWGAEMVAAIGSRPVVVELIRRHQDKPVQVVNEVDELLVALQWADDQN